MVNRSFKAKDRFGADLEFELKEPTLLEETEAEMQYRKAYSCALKEGLLTRRAMKELMEENGIWRTSDEAEMAELAKDIALLEIKLGDLETKSNLEECGKIAGELAEKRSRLFDLFLLQQSSYVHSCEGYAEMVRIESLMAACTIIKAGNKRYWKTYKEYIVERDENNLATVVKGVRDLNEQILADQRQQMVEKWPEQKWLKDIKTRVLSEDSLATKILQERIEEVKSGESVGTTNIDSKEGTI